MNNNEESFGKIRSGIEEVVSVTRIPSMSTTERVNSFEALSTFLTQARKNIEWETLALGELAETSTFTKYLPPIHKRRDEFREIFAVQKICARQVSGAIEHCIAAIDKAVTSGRDLSDLSCYDCQAVRLTFDVAVVMVCEYASLADRAFSLFGSIFDEIVEHVRNALNLCRMCSLPLESVPGIITCTNDNVVCTNCCPCHRDE